MPVKPRQEQGETKEDYEGRWHQYEANKLTDYHERYCAMLILRKKMISPDLSINLYEQVCNKSATLKGIIKSTAVKDFV